MNRMLVVGGSGFIGRTLCQLARLRGYAVTSVSLHMPARAPEGVIYLVGNLADRELLKQLLSGKQFEYLVNCGGYIDHCS